MSAAINPLREDERQRLELAEELDRQVEANRGPRPLEGFAGGHTTWTEAQDDKSASEEYDAFPVMQVPGARST
jgi:hypothetical protein